MNERRFVLLTLSLVLAAACTSSDGGPGGEDIDVSDRDPRCVRACPATMPEYEGVGRVCNAASREQCLDECETRIAGVSPLCQSCLVEEACFSPSGCVGDDIYGMCENTTNTCTVYGNSTMCTFPIGDEAAKLRCYQQVDPRREVACTAEFRPTTECASLCP